MRNLYSQARSREEVARLFRIPPNRMGHVPSLRATFPGFDAPVVRQAADGERELIVMSWGFVLLQAGRAPRRVTNVRDDEILTSAFWRGSFEERRCLVPASSYCEPKVVKPAVWHWFALKGEEPRPLFAFPGIWRRWKGPIKKGGPTVELDVYAFVTTAPYELTRLINHERMSVLLTSESDFETWLSGSPEEAFALARSCNPEKMRIVQSGDEKKDLLAA